MTRPDPTHPADRPLPRRATWLCGLAIALAFLALRLDTTDRLYFHGDDTIVVWLVDEIVATGDWQPDWYRAKAGIRRSAYAIAEEQRTDLPHDHHYNFTGHILLAAALVKPLRSLGSETPTIVLLHHLSLAWDILSVLCVAAAAQRLGGSRLALVAAALYSVLPLTVQGSHYARPDAFLTAMGSLLLWLALRRPAMAGGRWQLASGLALGAATAGKASQLMLGLTPALAAVGPFLFTPARRTAGTLAGIVRDGLVLAALTAAVLGVMFALADIAPRDFWLSLLSVQRYYAMPGPPDRLEPYSWGIQLLNILHYFYSSLGAPLLLALLVGTAALWRSGERTATLVLAAPPLLFLLYFASVPAFFDRSFCALAGHFALLAAAGVLAVARALPGWPAMPVWVLLTLAFAWKPLLIQYHLQTDHLRDRHHEDRLAFQKSLKAQWPDFWIKAVDRSEMFSMSLPERPPKNPRLYAVEDLNDAHSRRYLALLAAHGFVEVARFEGDFADMPTNSLITVHEAARWVYFIRADERPAARH